MDFIFSVSDNFEGECNINVQYIYIYKWTHKIYICIVFHFLTIGWQRLITMKAYLSWIANIMVADGLAPCVARACTAMILTHFARVCLLCLYMMLVDMSYGPLAIYAKLWVAHAPGMPGTFSPPPTSKETAS